MNWKAPSTLAGNARLYVAVNATNNSGTDVGDQIHLQNFTFPQTTNVPAATITTNVSTISVKATPFFLFKGRPLHHPISYSWTFPGGTPSTSTAQNVWVKFATVGNKVCSLRVANNIINSPYTTKTISVNANPSAGIVYNSTVVLCEGDSIALSNVLDHGVYTYQWQRDLSNISGANSFTHYAKLSGSYRLSVTSSNGCTVITNPVVLNFNSKPTASLTSLNGTTSCEGDSIHLKAPSGSGLSYYWYRNNVLQAQSTDSNYYAKLTGSYYVKIFTSIGCNSKFGVQLI